MYVRTTRTSCCESPPVCLPVPCHVRSKDVYADSFGSLAHMLSQLASHRTTTNSGSQLGDCLRPATVRTSAPNKCSRAVFLRGLLPDKPLCGTPDIETAVKCHLSHKAPLHSLQGYSPFQGLKRMLLLSNANYMRASVYTQSGSWPSLGPQLLAATCGRCHLL